MRKPGLIINISLKSPTRPEQAWRSMLMPSLYEKRPLPSSGTVIGWYDDDDDHPTIGPCDVFIFGPGKIIK